MTSKPDFIIPGFSKAGTTWVFERLSELPNFDMPPVKELHYFNRNKNYNDGKAGDTHNYFLNRKRLLRNFEYSGLSFLKEYLKIYESNDETYLRLFKNLTRITGDVTPVYCLLSHDGIKKMANLINGIKIIFILRDPIDRAWSHFRMHLRRKNLTLQQYPEDKVIKYLDRDMQKKRGSYSEAIKKYRDSFTESTMRITFYDYLKEDSQKFLKDIVSYLGGKSRHVDQLDNITERSNASKEYPIPPKVYNFLKQKFKSEYSWLSDNFGGYCNTWISSHFSYMRDDNSIDRSKKFIAID